MLAVRIIDVPPGEAPVEVRNAWVGLVLPLSEGRATPRRILVAGVKSGPKGFIEFLRHLLARRLFIREGYEVDVLPALEILEKSNPSAAEWWRQNAPHLLGRRKRFVFPTNCCERIEV